MENEYWTQTGVAPNAKPGDYRASGENKDGWKGYGFTRPSSQETTSVWSKGVESGAGRACAIFPKIGEHKAKLKAPIKYLHDDTIEFPTDWTVMNPGNGFMCLYNEQMKLMMSWDPNAKELVDAVTGKVLGSAKLNVYC